MKKLRVLILGSCMILLFMAFAVTIGFSVAEAEVYKPAFTMRFEKKRAYKARPNNVITVKQKIHEAETMKPDFAKRFDPRRVRKTTKNNVMVFKRKAGKVGKVLTLKDHYDMRREYKKEPVSVIGLTQRNMENEEK